MPSARPVAPRPGAHRGRIPATALLALLTLASSTLRAQTIDDGIMMPRKSLCTGFLYTHDSWDQYWEGTLEARQREHRNDHDARASPGWATTGSPTG